MKEHFATLQAMLLQHEEEDERAAKLLIQAGAQLSDDFMVTAARAGNTNSRLWVQVCRKASVPTQLSPCMESACMHFSDSSSSSSAFAVEPAVAASPARLHELFCVIMSTLSSGGRGEEVQAAASRLLQQHSATASQWTVDQVQQLLQLAVQHQLDVVLQQLMEQLVVPAVQQQLLSPDYEQQLQVLVDLAAEKGLLGILWSHCRPREVSTGTLLRLLHVAASRSSSSRSVEVLLQQPAAQQLRDGDVEALMVKLARLLRYNHLGHVPNPLQLVLDHLPVARDASAVVAEQLLRIAVEAKEPENVTVLARGLPSAGDIPAEAIEGIIRLAIEKKLGNFDWVYVIPSAQGLSVEAVSELMTAALKAGCSWGWVAGLTAVATTMSRELLLLHAQELIDTGSGEFGHGKVLALLPAAAALTAGDVEGIVRAAMPGGGTSAAAAVAGGEGKQQQQQEQQQQHSAEWSSRQDEQSLPVVNAGVAVDFLRHLPASRQLCLSTVYQLYQELGELTRSGDLAHKGVLLHNYNIRRIWSALCSLPALQEISVDELHELLKLAIGKDLMPDAHNDLLWWCSLREQLSVDQLLQLLQMVVEKYVDGARGDSLILPVVLEALLALPAAQELSADQVQPLLLRSLGTSSQHFWRLPAAKSFSVFQLHQLADAAMSLIASKQSSTSMCSLKVLEGVVQSILQVKAAEELPAGVVCNLLEALLLVFSSTEGWEGVYGTSKEHMEQVWQRLGDLKAVQQLPLEQLLHLLSIGFKQGLVPGALWRLPAAKELSGEQVQQLMALGELGEQQQEDGRGSAGGDGKQQQQQRRSSTLAGAAGRGGQVGLGGAGGSKGQHRQRRRKAVLYGLSELAVLPAAEILPVSAVLQLLQHAVTEEPSALPKLMRLPAADSIAAADLTNFSDRLSPP